MADLRGQQLKDSYQNVVTRGTGNKLENGNGVEFADLDDKASLSQVAIKDTDYEEGTWTPEVGGSATYFVQDGVYRRFKNLYYIRFDMHIDSIGNGSISRIDGLPAQPFETAQVSYHRYSDLRTAVARAHGTTSTTVPSINHRGYAGGDSTVSHNESGLNSNNTRIRGTAWFIAS